MLTRRGREEGIAIISALLAVMVVFSLGVLWVTLSQHQATTSAKERVRTQAFDAAEAGLHAAMSQLTAYPYYTGTGGALTDLDPTAPNTLGKYTVVVCLPTWTSTVSYRMDDYVAYNGSAYKATVANQNDRPPGLSWVSAGVNVEADCNNRTFTDPTERYLISRGYAPTSTSAIGDKRRLEEVVSLVSTDGFKYALFASSAGVSGVNNSYVNGDVYSNTTVDLSNGATITGSVTAFGDVTTANNNTSVGGDIRATGNVTISGATTVSGSIYAGGTVAITGTVKGSVQAGGTVSVTGTGKVGGTIVSNAAPVPPVQRNEPTFTFNSANYSSVKTFTDQTSFNSVWCNQGGGNPSNCQGVQAAGTFYCASGCQPITISNAFGMTGDVTIISTAPVAISGQVCTNSLPCAGAPSLILISTYTAPCPISGSNYALNMSNNSTVPSNVGVLMYAPNGPIQFVNLKNFAGTVYGACISVGNNFTLSFKPLSPPGFNFDTASGTHFDIQAVNFKEVPFS